MTNAQGMDRSTTVGARRSDVQGLRAIAVIAVIAFHAGLPLPGGFAGVDVFFVISGFVITAMLDRLHSGTGIVLRDFYIRRFKRLTPALALTVLVTCLASILLLPPLGGVQQVTATTGAGAMLLVANAVIAFKSGGYFDPAAGLNPLLHTWSLSVEEQFYLVFPAVLILAFRRGRRAAIISVAVIGGVSLLLALLLGGAQWPFGFYGPTTRAWEFAAGALLALVPLRLPRKARLWIGVAGGITLLASLMVIDESLPWPGLWTLVPVLATTACIAAGGGENGGVTRVLGWRPLVVVGDYSYSLYLWHWPFICLAQMLIPGPFTPAVAAVLSIVPAVLSYRLVEERFRRARLRGRLRWVLAAAMVMLLPLVAAGGLYGGARVGWGLAPVVAANAADRAGHVGWDRCLRLDTQGTGAQQIDPDQCTFNEQESPSGRAAFLVGDSNAAMYAEPAIKAAAQDGRTLTIRTAAGCAFADVLRGTNGRMLDADQRCRDYFESTMRELLAAPRGSVVFIAESTSQWTLPDRSLALPGGTPTTDFAGRLAVMRDGLTTAVRALTASGQIPILVEPALSFEGPSTRATVSGCTTTLSVLTGSCPAPVALAETSADQVKIRASVAQVASAEGIGFVPIAATQCPNGTCSAQVEGTPVLMDQGHFSASFSELLAPQFSAAMGTSRQSG